ncbi:MAG: hypothetical protein LM600_00960 [Thaumarchaeota archaeon]|nr:hypothetical protein [Nitrososphaerota archaeon]
MRSVVESGSRVKVRRVNGKPYLYLVCPDGSEKCADRLDRYPNDIRALIESVRRPRGEGAGQQYGWRSSSNPSSAAGEC